MRRTIAFLKLLLLWWKNYRVYKRRAYVLAWTDAVNGVATADFIYADPIEDEEYALLDSWMQNPHLVVDMPVVNPFGRYKRISEELNNAEG